MIIAIVDDQKEERDRLRSCIEAYSQAKRIELETKLFESADALLESYRPLQYTVVFLDIYMPGRTGIEAAEEIRRSDSDTILVFLTGSMDFMPEAFNCHAYDYLPKPAEKEKIFKLLDSITRQDKAGEKTLSFICDRESMSLRYADIIAICSSGHYLEITGTDGTVYKTRLTFQAAASELENDSRFLLINRGILVNMDHILEFKGGSCYLKGDVMMPENVRNSRSIEEIWQNYMFSKLRRRSMERSGLK